MFRSIRVRLTIWYVVVLALVLAAFCAGVYFALRASLYSNLDDRLTTRAETLDGAIEVTGGEPGLSAGSAPGHPEGEEFVRVFSSEGTATFDNTSEILRPGIDEGTISAALNGATSHRSLGTQDDTMRVYTSPIRRGDAVIGVLQVGETEDDIRETLRILLTIVAIGYPLTLVLASAGGVFLAGRALRPVAEITDVARQISAEDLSERIDMDLPDDEVGRLARTFNDMIARLDEAFRRQRQFTADASHELRTPLTAIKGQAEVALQRERGAEEYRGVLAAINAEVDRMIRLTGSLLTLARADSARAIVRERMDLGQLVADAAEQLRPAAEARGIRMDIQSTSLPFTGDEDLLLQLVLNLTDNAIKYSNEGGHVTVSCMRDDSSALITVSDAGPGIPPEHLPHIFDRFYRIDAARGQVSGGAGLGLSISRWIAEAHGGTLTAESEPGRGSAFTARLPVASG
jgi:heavy metal sensor kinase